MLEASEGQTKVIKEIKYLDKRLGDNVFSTDNKKTTEIGLADIERSLKEAADENTIVADVIFIMVFFITEHKLSLCIVFFILKSVLEHLSENTKAGIKDLNEHHRVLYKNFMLADQA